MSKFTDLRKAGLRQAGAKREAGLRGQGSRGGAGSWLASFVEALASTGIHYGSRKPSRAQRGTGSSEGMHSGMWEDLTVRQSVDLYYVRG